ncbi:hypothetical protein HNP86_001926 [Methanococcus maripaludis]|uniref:Uncharacterized protein n=1 Tax=Methanococcus maripaludis TaxID=39152 RepID=A0A7J9NWS6_METMI|nr:hypothetical protein [Methanococcus maripaludis]MBA2851767.1 hypothetical protein [Methanococcus maripaludis]
MLLNGILPAKKISNVSISKNTIFAVNDNNKHLEQQYQNVIPYSSSYFDVVKNSDNMIQPKSRLINQPDTFTYSTDLDMYNVFKDTMSVNYINSQIYSRNKNYGKTFVRMTLSLPFHYQFMDENFWYNSTLYVPTSQYSKSKDAWVYYRIDNSILESAAFTLNINAANTCEVTIVVPKIEAVYRDYDISNWYDYDFCPMRIVINKDLDIKTITYSKSSTVSINNVKSGTTETMMYVYDVYQDKINKWNGFMVSDLPNSYALDVDMYMTQSFYKESAKIVVRSYDIKLDSAEKQSIAFTGNTFSAILDIYVDTVSKSGDADHEIGGEGVIRWL